MSRMLALWSLSCLVFATSGAPPSRVVATASAMYLEDALVPRPVAAVQARLCARGGERWLEVELSPRGAGVDPLPGFAGMPGVNLRTAEELARLVADDALRLVTRHDGSSVPGALVRVELGTLPAREVDADGLLREVAAPGDWPVRVVFRSAPLPAGATWSHLESDGVPRLALHVDAAGEHGAAVLTIASLAEPAPIPAGAAGGRR
jgi:hypothetical protein